MTCLELLTQDYFVILPIYHTPPHPHSNSALQSVVVVNEPTKMICSKAFRITWKLCGDDHSQEHVHMPIKTNKGYLCLIC